MFRYLMCNSVLSIWAEGIRDSEKKDLSCRSWNIYFTGFYIGVFNNADGASLPSHKNALCSIR